MTVILRKRLQPSVMPCVSYRPPGPAKSSVKISMTQITPPKVERRNQTDHAMIRAKRRVARTASVMTASHIFRMRVLATLILPCTLSVSSSSTRSISVCLSTSS